MHKVNKKKQISGSNKTQTAFGDEKSKITRQRIRTIVILEDMIDSGRSMTYLIDYLKGKNPKAIKVATMFYKPKALTHPVTVDYCALELENDFVVGRGLDYDGLGRNYPDLYILSTATNG